MREMIVYRLITIVLLIFLSTDAICQRFNTGPVPDWAIKVTPPLESKVSRNEVVSGGYPSLIDNQFHFPSQAMYYHVAIDVLTHGGVQGVSDMRIPYDSSYQHVTFHYLRVWRDGKADDRTDDLTFEFIRTEENLNQRMYTGQVTAFDVLEDIRKDDRVEYAFTVYGRNPIFEGRPFLFMPLAQRNPVGLVSVRLLSDTSAEYSIECKNCVDVVRTDSVIENLRVTTYVQKDIPAADLEKTLPPWHRPFPHLTLTAFRNWREVEQWASAVFNHGPNPETEALAAKLTAKHPDFTERITAAINHVQDQIRYMGMEDGIGSIRPRAPDQVIRQGFGDCKDKSLLLVTLLRAMGIDEAWPTLVSNQMRRGLFSMPPAGQLFDHCIVHYKIDGRPYWIDPTINRQGGNYTLMRVPDFGAALVVGSGEGQLVQMGVDDLVSRVERNEEFTTTSFSEPCTLRVSTRYHGANADHLRGLLEQISSKELSDAFRKDIGRAYPGITTHDPLKIDDDVARNIIQVNESYLLHELWKEVNDRSYSGWYFRYEPIDMYGYVLFPECDQKQHPVHLRHPVNMSQFTVFNVPRKDWLRDEDEIIDNDYFNYNRIVRDVSAHKASVAYVFITKADEMDPDSYSKTCTQLKVATDRMPVIISCPKTR